jgi:hypothetical protein
VLAKIAALIAHEILAPVIAEYRKLGQQPGDDDHRYDAASTTAAHLERADGTDRPEVRFGFGRKD